MPKHRILGTRMRCMHTLSSPGELFGAIPDILSSDRACHSARRFNIYIYTPLSSDKNSSDKKLRAHTAEFLNIC